MKFYETHYEEYINASQRENLHPKLSKILNVFPEKINDLKNVIIYGASGIGKYTQMLNCIKKYSPSELKYEKKFNLTYDKRQYFFKISDIHYEVDMSLLGCHSKLLWHEIYQQIIEIVSAKNEKHGIIVCKYFHEIHSELLDNFYSYMQKNNATTVHLSFFILTEELSFIPDNILNCCEVINISRPNKTTYNKCFKQKNMSQIKLDDLTNIKHLNFKNLSQELLTPHKIICNKILENILNINENNFLKFRDVLYDIFIYNLNITHCVWYILSVLIEKKKLTNENMSDVLIKTFCFFQYYNNNYRPIYHLENYLFFLVKTIHHF
jgi:hypothetical protein